MGRRFYGLGEGVEWGEGGGRRTNLTRTGRGSEGEPKIYNNKGWLGKG